MKRGQNTGSIGIGKGGRLRVRVTMADGKRRSFGSFADPAVAESALRGILDTIDAGRAVAGDVPTLATYEPRFFAVRRRRARSAHAVKSDESRWALYIANAPFAATPLPEVRPRDVQRWVDALAETETSDRRGDRLLSRQTVKHCLNLLRSAFKSAIRAELVTDHPVKGVELPPENRTHDPWDFLRPAEQAALLTCERIPLHVRLTIAFALFTGLRRGEQWALRLDDVHTEGSNPHVVVRFGSPGKATKTNRIRRVQLFGDGLAATREWIELLPSFAPKNPLGLVFPTARGAARDGLDLPRMQITPGEQPTEYESWRHYLALAGIVRPFRWYDLRHSFASSLVSGFWGRRWSLEEVRELLGHTSITMTQRYAHLADTTLREAADGTAGLPGLAARLATPIANYRRVTLDSNQRPSASEAEVLPYDSALIGNTGGHGLANLVLIAIATGQADALVLARALASMVLDAREARLARAILDDDPTWAAKACALADALLGSPRAPAAVPVATA